MRPTNIQDTQSHCHASSWASRPTGRRWSGGPGSGLPYFISVRLDLDCAVCDLEAVPGALLHERQHGSVRVAGGHDHVGAHPIHTRGERPDMQIVDGADPRKCLEAPAKGLNVDVFGRALQEYADRFTEQPPRPRQDGQPNRRRDERVGEKPPGRVDDDG